MIKSTVTCKLGDYVLIKTGKLDANASSPEGAYPFFTCSQNPLRINSFSYDCECVLVAGNGDLNVKYYNGKFDAYQRTYIIESLDNTKLDVRYLFHFMSVYINQLRLKRIGGVIKYIKLGNLTDAYLPLPPLAKQLRIVEILDRAEALRAKRRTALAQLDTLSQAIFFDLFGNPATNPKGWPVRPLGLEIWSVRYGTGSPPDYVDEGVPFIRATNIKDGTINPKNLVRISSQDAERIPKCKVSFGDLIVVRSGVNTGDCATVQRGYDGAYAAYDLIVELPLENAFFYNFLINSPYGKRYLSPITRRAAQQHLNANQLRALTFFAPPMSIKKEFAQCIKAVEKLKATHRSSLEKMDHFFVSLRYRAFLGEL